MRAVFFVDVPMRVRSAEHKGDLGFLRLAALRFFQGRDRGTSYSAQPLIVGKAKFQVRLDIVLLKSQGRFQRLNGLAEIFPSLRARSATSKWRRSISGEIALTITKRLPTSRTSLISPGRNFCRYGAELCLHLTESYKTNIAPDTTLCANGLAPARLLNKAPCCLAAGGSGVLFFCPATMIIRNAFVSCA